MIALKAQHRLEDLLIVAGLSRSTFFYHQARLSRSDPNTELKAALRSAFDAGMGRYGHRRVHYLLRLTGWRVAKKTVLRLMGELGLRCHVRRRRPHMSWRGHVGKVAGNVLDRQFDADAPNQKWVSDVTEFHLAGHKIFLSAVMDLFDHQIIAHQISRSPNIDLTNQSLDRALAAQSPEPGLIVHTDQGFQYQHRTWQQRLTDAGAICSMSRRGNCHDNSVMENFFSHLKTEASHTLQASNPAELITAINDYITWWNTHRVHTRLHGLSPTTYRTQVLAV